MTPNDRKFTKTHEWVKIDGAHAFVGISDHAQDSLGDITFVELPPVGKKMTKGKACCVIESVKAASDINAPVSGEIASVNREVQSQPEIINKDPYGEGWIFTIKDFSKADLDGLMDSKSYEAFVSSEA
ncbi:MAG: glycine cleavage system protein GcvH [Chitinivibrionales bacterium]